MTNNPSHNNQPFYRLPIVWGGVAVLLGCLVLSAICWFTGPKSPVSPPPTELGSDPTFDTILASANEDWRFLFVFKGQFLTTDIYGQNDQVLFEITEATGSRCSRPLDEGSLSPDSKYLVIKYDNDERTADTGDIIGRLIIFDLENGSVEKILTPLEGFRLRWYSDISWLSPTVFIVPMHKWIYKNDHTEEIIKFLRYDVQALDNPQLIELETDRPISTFSDETVPNMRIEPVIDRNVEPLGRYYNENWHRHYIYLNNKLVRISDGEIDGPTWDPDLKVFVWDEFGRPDVFYMDAEGHYRSWHNGSYWGKIPKSLQVTAYQKQGIDNCR